MKCPHCGKQNEEGEKYCRFCGFPLAIVQGEVAEETPPLSAAKKSMLNAGKLYTSASVFVQLGATALIFALSFLAAFLYGEGEIPSFFNYAAFSTQILLLLCIFFFCLRHKIGPGQMGLRPAKISLFLPAVVLGVGAIYWASFAEVYFEEFLLNFLGYDAAAGDVTAGLPLGKEDFWIALVMIAVLPAIGEELLFRGVILDGTKKIGTFWACLLNGFLFSLFHCNPAQTCHTFIFGFVLALIALRTGSVLPGMIVHFLNNGFAVVTLFFAPATQEEYMAAGSPWLIAEYVLLGAALVAVPLFIWFVFGKNMQKAKRKTASGKFWKGAIVGVIFNAALWAFAFFDSIYDFTGKILGQ